MIKKLQVSIMLEQSIKKVVLFATCLLALANFTYAQVYDLSLITGVSSAFGPDFCPGDEVRINSAVYNVGDIEACDVEITAYIPDGMTLTDSPLNSIWEVSGSTATTTISECIPPGGVYPSSGSLQLSVIQIIDMDFPGNTINFYTEISADDGDDIDSTPDRDPNNDAGAEPGTVTDNAINNPNDEDDHDVAQISLGGCDRPGCTDPCAPNYDAAASSDDGSCEDYDTDVCNSDICDGDVTEWDSGDCGCVLVTESVSGCTDDDATNYDPDANCDDDSCEYDPVGCTDPCAPNYNPDAEEDDGSCEDYSTRCNDDICDGDITEWDSGSCDCELVTERVRGCDDPDAQNYDPEANCNDPDRCVYETGDYDLALIKGISSSLSTRYCPGDEVRFNIAIYNQGEVEACDVEVTEYIPSGMSLSSDSRNSIWSGGGSAITTNIVGCIPPGGAYPNDNDYPLSVWLVIDEDFAGSSISNYAEISSDDGDDIDSRPDQDPDNDSGADPSTGTDHTIHGQNGDEDDHDVVVITIDPSCSIVGGCTDPCAPNYDPDAEDDDGSCDDYSTRCNDDICDGDITEWDSGSCDCELVTEQVIGCDDPDAENYNADANCNDPDSCEYALGGCTDPCAPNYDPDVEDDDGSCDDYSTRCNDDICDGDITEWDSGSCDCELVTEQVIGCDDPDAENYNADANCNDPDSCEYQEDVVDLSLVKTLDPDQTVISPCDDVIFTVEVCNEGTVTVYNIEVTDILPDGFQLSHGDNFGWERDADGNYSQTIDEGIEPGECVSLPISIKPRLAADPGMYTNNASISGMTDADGDSLRDDNTSNNSSGEEITIVDTEFDLSLIMYAGADQPSSFTAGDDVTFNISIFNRGGQNADDIEVTNYIPSGMSLSSSRDNDDWTDNGDGTATTVISLDRTLLPCRSFSFPIVLTIDEDAEPGNYINVAEISAADDSSGNPGDDIDSVMDTDPTNDAGGNANSQSDNNISGDGTGFPGSSDFDSDEDDADPALIVVGTGLRQISGNGNFDTKTKRLGQSEIASTIKINKLFPTITSSELNMIVDASDKLSVMVQIIDFEGKVLSDEVFQLRKSLNSLTFDVSELPNGMYFINAVMGDQLFSNKFVKN